MTYKVSFDNDDFVDNATSPSKIDGGAATTSNTTFLGSQTFNSPLINNGNLFVSYKNIYGPNGGRYDASLTLAYVIEPDDYIIRLSPDGEAESVNLYNKAIGDTITIKNDFLKSIKIWAGIWIYGGGTINGSTGTWSESAPYTIGSNTTSPNFATFLCVGTNAWITI